MVWPDTGDYITEMPEHINEKEEQNRQRGFQYSEHGDDSGGY